MDFTFHVECEKMTNQPLRLNLTHRHALEGRELMQATGECRPRPTPCILLRLALTRAGIHARPFSLPPRPGCLSVRSATPLIYPRAISVLEGSI